ncbi:hypothetical protein [Streptomyces sp. NPDC001068]|uniref:hypothetical protein n=1 Tax=Streptomyces sp. NPDC001068 TaxID=3364544 RepID=UPI0036A9B3A0
MTVADLVSVGPDGREAVRAGLLELERYGYLVRERLRRGDGTLGGVVYAVTDRPAVPGGCVPVTVPAVAVVDERDAGGGSGVRRGVMAGAGFTRVGNGLLRDGRLSFRAKGIYGFLSSHREGWHVSVAGLVRGGCEGVVAVSAGIGELECFGYLCRGRERHGDGTLGRALYVITDLPAGQDPGSPPGSGFPGLAEPVLAGRGGKKTRGKKTTREKTSSFPPCGAGAAGLPVAVYQPGGQDSRPGQAGQDSRPGQGGPDGSGAATAPGAPGSMAAPVPSADVMHAGIRLLLEVGAVRPELLLTGKTLTDQGRVVTVMLEAGWSAEHLRQVIAGRPLPDPVHRTVGAIIAARLRAAQAYPPPAGGAGRWDGPVRDDRTRPEQNTSAASRSVGEALAWRALVECAGCGRPGTATGEDLCPACLGWPLCRTCPGPTPRHAHPRGDGRCTTCTSAVNGVHAEKGSP